MGTTDPWREALDRHITGEMPAAPGGGTGPGRRGRRLLPWILLAAALVALIAVAASAFYAVGENRDRAEGWQDRSEEVEALLAARTRALNRQTARLNVAATRLREARTAISRSEADVRDLEERQRQLAAEKASVEDDRLALQGVAQDLNDCRNGLAELLDDVLNEIEPDQATVQSTQAACDAADAALQGE